MWTWLLNPKNLLLAALGVCCAGLLIAFLWYRGSYESASAKVKVAEMQIAEARAQIEEANRDMALIKVSQAKQQVNNQKGAILEAEIRKLKARALTDEESIVADRITNSFNGVLRDGIKPQVLQGNPAGGEVLPASGTSIFVKPKDGSGGPVKLQPSGDLQPKP